MKEENPGLRIAVAGCLVQGFGREIKEGFPEIDYWIEGPDDSSALAEILRDYGLKPTKRSEGFIARKRLFGETGSAYLKVARGCSNCCSYCSIPQIKGPLRSRSLDSIDEEAKHLCDIGIKEVVLVAQDLAAYGSEGDSTSKLPHLLERVLAHPFRWVRLMYVHPKWVDPDFISMMNSDGRICPYLDIPFQHAHSRVLQLMGRQGSKEEYLRLLDELRENIPRIAIRTTLISGHPGEGSKEFDELMNFVERAKFEWLGVFPYMPEEGTPSSRLSNGTSQEEAMHRAGLIEECFRGARDVSAFALGSEKDALVIDDVDDILICRSASEAPEVDGVIMVKKDGAELPRPGDLTSLIVTDLDDFDFVGRLLR